MDFDAERRRVQCNDVVLAGLGAFQTAARFDREYPGDMNILGTAVSPSCVTQIVLPAMD